MDVAIVVDRAAGRRAAVRTPFRWATRSLSASRDSRRAAGAPARQRARSSASCKVRLSERAKALAIHEVAEAMRAAKA